MTKEIKERIKMQVPGGAATPAPPVGSTLGQKQVNIMEFCKRFNDLTKDRKGETVPVVITVYKDKSFDITIKSAPVTDLIRKKARITKGSATPHSAFVGQITKADVEEIAKIKLPDLNAIDLEAAKRCVEGSARSMGVKVVD